jgi:dTDP-glucose 4,6-dehydratase
VAGGRSLTNYLVTGGAGFIGSNFCRYLLSAYPDCHINVLDSFTYAGNPENIPDDVRVQVINGNICDKVAVQKAIENVDVVVHFAAETHVDRSINSAEAAVQTNVLGTFQLLEAARSHSISRFVHVSTDEVYGTASTEPFHENSPLNPRNPYSASKAAADRLAYSYFVTYGLPVIITRPTNTYGPYQYPEKLIPFFVNQALNDQPLPVYGNGQQQRDWLHVSDHCAAIDLLIQKGTNGEAYNIVGHNERVNMEVVETILGILDKPRSLIKHVEDRPGHDTRYYLDGRKLQGLGWSPRQPWMDGMEETVLWFKSHSEWLESSLSRGKDFMEKWYAKRLEVTE